MLGKHKLLTVLLLLLLFCFSSCGNQQASLDTEEQTTPAAETPIIIIEEIEPSPTPEPEETPPPEVDDGFVVPDSNVRPVAVMIDNQGDRVLPRGNIPGADSL